MPYLRRLVTPLLMVAALAGTLIAVVAPASTQGQAIKVIVIANDMVNGEDPDERWQMQVNVHPTGGCRPTQGDVGYAGYASSWLEAGTEFGLDLSVGECIFRIDVTMRQANLRTDCSYTAQLSWDPAGGTTPVDDWVLTSNQPAGTSRLSAVRKAGSACAFPPETRFYITGSEIVENLPGSSANADLLELARRAAEVASFGIRIEPDTSDGAVPAGCNRTSTLTVRGDGVRVRHALPSGGETCALRAVVRRAQAPFEAAEGREVTFTDDFRIIDLTSLVRLPQARIAIIQDVAGSDNNGSASYTISRSCGDVSVTSPAPTSLPTPLHVGRFTVHSPSAPNFGATHMYPAAAASATSDDIVGCSVTATVRDLPADCTVEGGSTQTLTWSAGDPLRNFDFEFDIDCGAGTDAPTTTPTSAPTTTGTQPAEEAEDMTPLEDDSTADPPPATTPAAPEGPVADMPTG